MSHINVWAYPTVDAYLNECIKYLYLLLNELQLLWCVICRTTPSGVIMHWAYGHQTWPKGERSLNASLSLFLDLFGRWMHRQTRLKSYFCNSVHTHTHKDTGSFYCSFLSIYLYNTVRRKSLKPPFYNLSGRLRFCIIEITSIQYMLV